MHSLVEHPSSKTYNLMRLQQQDTETRDSATMSLRQGHIQGPSYLKHKDLFVATFKPHDGGIRNLSRIASLLSSCTHKLPHLLSNPMQADNHILTLVMLDIFFITRSRSLLSTKHLPSLPLYPTGLANERARSEKGTPQLCGSKTDRCINSLDRITQPDMQVGPYRFCCAPG
jgi:hypothetical protein